MAYLAQPTSPTSPTAGRSSSRRTHVRPNTPPGDPLNFANAVALPHNPDQFQSSVYSTLDLVAQRFQYMDIQDTAMVERVESLKGSLTVKVDRALLKITNVDLKVKAVGTDVQGLIGTGGRLDSLVIHFHDALRDTTRELDDSMEERSETLHKRINAMSVELNKCIRKIEGNVATLSNRVGGLEGNVATLSNRVGALEGTVATLSNRVGALEGQIDALGGRIGALEGRVGALEGRVGALERTVADGFSQMDDKLDLILRSLSAPR